MIPEQVEGIREVTFDELQMREREKRRTGIIMCCAGDSSEKER